MSRLESCIDPREEILIVSHVTKADYHAIELGAVELSAAEIEKIDALIEERKKGVPLEYLLGKVEFFGLSLKLTRDVLIPRPETELLVEKIVQNLQGEILLGKRGLDLCTGSGCIGLAIKKYCPNLEIILSDISSSAIGVAKQNSQINNLSVEFALGHLFDGVGKAKFDYLFCNPPYIPAYEYAHLNRSVKVYEPLTALHGGEDGLMFYRMIERDAKLHLHQGAKCFFEIGYNQGKGVMQIFSGLAWDSQVVIKDYAGHDRFFFLEFRP